ncbi:hypothetical protein ACX8Z9_03365 [Arthrobacter halodurans]|uniref:Uncharacterized protein n=1 Tax=Arthrobacter halodurans TaxID=516699 RepID=A0ABV4UL20_9MICC
MPDITQIPKHKGTAAAIQPRTTAAPTPYTKKPAILFGMTGSSIRT